MICVPATLTGVVAAAIVSMFIGKDLKDDPEYQARLKAGQIPAPKAADDAPPLKPSAKLSAYHVPGRRRAGRAVRLLPRRCARCRAPRAPLGDADRHRDRDDVGGRDHAAGHQGQRRRGAEDARRCAPASSR